MNKSTTTIPEGWGYESEDRSVGIFGDSIWHDACGLFNEADDTLQEAIVVEHVVGYEGEGYNRSIKLEATLTCPVCGAEAIWTKYEYDPETEDG